MGVVIYMHLKHTPDYIDSKYIWIHESNSLGSSVLAEIPFWPYTGKEEVWPGGTQPMLLPESSCICISRFRYVAPRVFLAEYHIWLFLITMVTIYRNF